MEDKFIELLKYIAENLEMESRFLTTTPNANVEVIGLLDKIAELRDISKEQNGIEFNSIMDSLEN